MLNEKFISTYIDNIANRRAREAIFDQYIAYK